MPGFACQQPGRPPLLPAWGLVLKLRAVQMLPGAMLGPLPGQTWCFCMFWGTGDDCQECPVSPQDALACEGCPLRLLIAIAYAVASGSPFCPLKFRPEVDMQPAITA